MSWTEAWRFWTNERCDWLRALYAAGLSASAIAEEMGLSSRGAVCGKVHRLGLTRDNHPSSANRGAHPRHRKPTKPRPVRHDRFRPVKIAPPVVEPMPDIADDQIPLEQRRTLDQLTNTTCRWPVGDPASPDFFFCGHESCDNAIGIPYCAAHAKRASAGPGRAPDRYPWGRGRE